jgi:hypothetical protein
MVTGGIDLGREPISVNVLGLIIVSHFATLTDGAGGYHRVPYLGQLCQIGHCKPHPDLKLAVVDFQDGFSTCGFWFPFQAHPGFQCHI